MCHPRRCGLTTAPFPSWSAAGATAGSAVHSARVLPNTCRGQEHRLGCWALFFLARTPLRPWGAVAGDLRAGSNANAACLCLALSLFSPCFAPLAPPSRHPPSQSLPHSGTPPWQSCRCRCQGAGLYTDAQGGAARVSRGGAGTHTPTTHQPLQAPHLHASHRPTLEGLIIKGLLSRLDSGLRGRCGHRRGARHAAPRLGCSSSSGAEHERCAERARAQHMQTVHRSSSPRTRISQIGGLLGSALLLLLLLRQRVGQAAAARAAARKGSC